MTSPIVHVPERVIHGIAGCALHAGPDEAGGLLIGWREGPSVSVMDFIEIPSTTPRRATYELSVAVLNTALGHYLEGVTDSRLGYIGSWHSHPAALGPSLVDERTFLKIARAHCGPLAFLVVAADGHSTVLYWTWAGLRNGRHRLIRQAPVRRTSE